MKILALDTAMAACSAAVLDTESPAPLAEAYVAMERGHAEAIAPMVADVLARSGTALDGIDRIAVTTGPGTFTGVRIGLAFARGLGLARSIPVIGIDSLTAIAANETAAEAVLVVSDARNDEVYAALLDAGRRAVSQPHVTTVRHAADQVPAGTLLLGTAAGAVRGASGRGDLILSSAEPLPVAATFGRLAAHAVPGAMPPPLYLRVPDAKPQAPPLRKAGPVAFEPAPAAAAALLATLHAEAFGQGWTTAAFAQLLHMPGAAAEIALEHGEPVAFILTRTAADEAEIITTGTRPSAQRRGIARRLLAHHLGWLAGQGVRQVFLEVAAGNGPAQALYRAAGFAAAGRRKGYYLRPQGREDAIVMRQELRP